MLEVLKLHNLFATIYKCHFGIFMIEYLGHVISMRGVEANPTKISIMLEWPIPTTLKSLRGFYVLIGYYNKFIRDYSAIASLLTQLLKKNSLVWNDKATKAFHKLKSTTNQHLVLTLLNFSNAFIIKCDAPWLGLGAVLMQDGYPINFYGKALKHKTLLLSTY